jgi:cysteine desulfuration protein SufE
MSTESNDIEQAQQELISEFQLFDDWMGRYEYLIDLGKQLPEFPGEWQNEENRIHGCQSQVWIQSGMRDGRLHFDGTSDAAIVRGLIAVLFRVFNDRRPQDLLASKPDFLAEIGFAQHLSPTRSNGLHAMLESIYLQAQLNAMDGEEQTRTTVT